MVHIKLCGFTKEEDLKKAVELGVEYVGIVLYPESPRYVGWDRIGALLEAGRGANRVAVMVNPTYEEVKEALQVGFDLIQLHGEEDLSLAKRIGLERVIKAFRTCHELSLPEDWKRAHGVLLDACSRLYGGSGQKADWKMAREVVEKGFRVFLAGGLKPDNVAEAIKDVGPYGVDASSGVERSPGIKDHRRMEEFVHAVKNAFENRHQP
ncbi:MAG: phosphoribosylanthranilate isomerase [Aquificaceae bacterium]|nr:phosphoribosylanthranilate isomerase [Aquificaceae bacterium]